MMSYSTIAFTASFGLIFALCTTSGAQPTYGQAAKINGTVRNQLTSEPLPIVTVRLVKQGSPPLTGSTSGVTTITDQAGRFEFPFLAVGAYLLSAERVEFASDKPILVHVDKEVTIRDLQLSPLGVIAGTAFGNDGDPIPGVSIAAMRVAADGGRIQLAEVAHTTTDDLGSYRLHGLPPGRFYIRVNSRERYSDTANGSSGTRRPILYPVAADSEQATTLTVKSGTVLTGIDLAVPTNSLSENSANVTTLASGESAIIAGQVLNAATGGPVPRARVVLQNGSGADEEISTMRSDASGIFKFTGVPAGTYQINASHPNFLARPQGGFRGIGSNNSVTVSSGQLLDDVALRLIPQSVIAGKILDGNTPVANAIVIANRSSSVAGQRKLVLVSRTYTNDLGEYRLFDLPPGHYYLSVTYRGGTAPGPPQFGRPQDGQHPPPEDYANTFYPQALALSDAVPIEVAPGSVQTSIDIALSRMHKWTVRGSVVLPATPHFSSPPSVVLLPRDSFEVLKFSQRTATVDPRNGGFEITGVPPGGYILSADVQVGEDRYSASLPLNVTKTDVEGLVLSLTRSFSVRGRVTAQQSAACDLSGLSVNARTSSEASSSRSAGAEVDKNGLFVLVNIRPGHYYVNLAGLTGDCYLKFVSLESRNVSSRDVEFNQSSSSVELILSGAGGQIDGTVVDDQRQPFKSAMVVLIPQPPLRDRSDLYKVTSSDASGKFSMRGISPGEYGLFAWDAIEPDLYLDPDALAPFENLGRRASISEGEKKTVELTVIANGETSVP